MWRAHLQPERTPRPCHEDPLPSECFWQPAGTQSSMLQHWVFRYLDAGQSGLAQIVLNLWHRLTSALHILHSCHVVIRVVMLPDVNSQGNSIVLFHGVAHDKGISRMPYLAIGLDAGPVLTVQVLPVPIALAPPDLNAYGVQLEVPRLVGLNLLLICWSNLKHKRCQRSINLRVGKYLSKKPCTQLPVLTSLTCRVRSVCTSGPLLSCPVKSEAQEILRMIYKHCGLPYVLARPSEACWQWFLVYALAFQPAASRAPSRNRAWDA